MLCASYKSLCPRNPKKNAFYLQPLKCPTEKVWFSREPVGRNKLATTVQDMCKTAGISGFRTNHSLRATSASGADKQLIMERTGHRIVDDVCSYKCTADHLTENVSNILNCSKKCRLPTPEPSSLSAQTAVRPHIDISPPRVHRFHIRAPLL